MSIPHRKFVGRWCGDHASRRLHNGRLSKYPNRAARKQRNRHEMDRFDWLSEMSKEAVGWMARRFFKEQP